MPRALAAGAVFAIAVVMATTGASAQGLISIQKLSAPLANELVGETVAQCAQKGYTVTAVVVDLDGVRQALLRGNGAPTPRTRRRSPFAARGRPTRSPRCCATPSPGVCETSGPPKRQEGS